MQKKLFVKGVSGVLSILLVMTVSSPIKVSALSSSSNQKEEVVYCTTNEAGSIKNVEVVNIFNKGTIVDYGDYSSVKILNTNDEISLNNNKVSFSTDADKVYYQGSLKDKSIPWNINISYELDGKEISASEIAGKTGELKIHFVITKNENSNAVFYDNYALEASFTLDSGICKNITTDSGTIANVGSKKRITYTILPGKGIDTYISADVTDFVMDAVTINGLKLNLNINIDDDILMYKVRELMGATDKLKDGAVSLQDGTGSLKDGTKSFSDGTASLATGAEKLDAGIQSLNNGMTTLQSGLDTLNSKSSSLVSGSSQMLSALETLEGSLENLSISTDKLTQLTESSSAIKTGISNIKAAVDLLEQNVSYSKYVESMASNGLDIAAIKSSNQATIESLNSQISDLQDKVAALEGNSTYQTEVEQMETEISSFQSIVTLLTGNNYAICGTESYLNTLNTSIEQLDEGIEVLETNYEEFDEAISTLAETMIDMTDKLYVLKSGIDTLVTNYTTLNDGIESYTDGVAQVVAGYDQLTNGVSELATGSGSLLDGVQTLSSGSEQLYNGTSSLYDGCSQLADGTAKLSDSTSNMDQQVQDQIDEILSSVKGGNVKTVSFVSDKNTNVSSVQFVIKTNAIELDEVQKTDEKPEENLNFFQKLLKLFGIKY